MSTVEPLAAGRQKKDFGLSPLERQLIALTISGWTREGSTQRLGISMQALERHLANIYDKLNVVNDLEMVLFCVSYKLIGPVQASPRRKVLQREKSRR